MPKIAIFASGSGTNAENLIRSFAQTDISIIGVFTNNANAGVVERARNLNVPVTVFGKQEFYDTHYIYDILQKESVEYIVLAGFLWFIPQILTDTYKDRIINIHPSLLPKYGGCGMFGIHVHEAVIANGEKESGITIHLVNEVFDSGKTLFQTTCPVLPTDKPEDLAARVHALEYKYFPQVVEQYIYAK